MKQKEKQYQSIYGQGNAFIDMSGLIKYPQLYNKQTSGYHNRDKRVTGRQLMATAFCYNLPLFTPLYACCLVKIVCENRELCLHNTICRG